ncbi:MAG: hypothetical protein EOO38_24430 [Cytophagaceae bacterium]|nr:MAG: hypothetical protein EOO38_24430 [Cytophagaceae bacterium]
MHLHRHFCLHRVPPRHSSLLTQFPEIYRIVSSKALDQGEGSQNVLGGERKVLEISKAADEGQKKNGCC